MKSPQTRRSGLSARLIACLLLLTSGNLLAADERDVINHYLILAKAVFGDALDAARQLGTAVDQLIAEPSEANLQAARVAWKAARVPYLQSEAFRFANPVVDEWEGKVNAWPLDEGLIDYVAASYGEESEENPFFTANIIANPTLTLAGREIDASHIDKQLLAKTLHELDGVEANVATGYHAIEFLLWGQDLNGTKAGAGTRPASDFDPKNCSNGHCERRAAYLKAATELLIDDLTWMVEQWSFKGPARVALRTDTPKATVARILTGLGSLSFGELAGERMKLGLMLHDPEEEQDCFSDNTHYAHYYDAVGIRNLYTGRYQRLDGSQLQGPSLSDLVRVSDATADRDLREHLDATVNHMQALVDSAEQKGQAYDQLIAPGNTQGNAKVLAAINSLVEQTHAIERALAALGMGDSRIQGSPALN